MNLPILDLTRVTPTNDAVAALKALKTRYERRGQFVEAKAVGRAIVILESL